MPPITVSSDDSGSEDEVRPGKGRQADDSPNEEKDEPMADEKDEKEDADDDEDDEEEENEYVVEEIIDHQFYEDGVIHYLVKWKGYERKSDRTWEPISNLTGASDALAEYHNKIGGKPVRKAPLAKRNRDSASNTPQTGRKSSKTRRLNDNTPPVDTSNATSSELGWRPPKGSWEDEIQAVDIIEQNKNGLFVYLRWNNKKITRHAIEETYRKCPQKMLQFYEQHL
ncbi:MAG: hypothetical protein M1832_000179 [Thelocarpon impressellum]|nr:MAG: hypothetical protein M1832_000179 [Thelocarpon impressellum]